MMSNIMWKQYQPLERKATSHQDLARRQYRRRLYLMLMPAYALLAIAVICTFYLPWRNLPLLVVVIYALSMLILIASLVLMLAISLAIAYDDEVWEA